MKKLKFVTAVAVLLTALSVHADSNTECWTDSNGNTHCTTTESSKDDITPKGAY